MDMETAGVRKKGLDKKGDVEREASFYQQYQRYLLPAEDGIIQRGLSFIVRLRYIISPS